MCFPFVALKSSKESNFNTENLKSLAFHIIRDSKNKTLSKHFVNSKNVFIQLYVFEASQDNSIYLDGEMLTRATFPGTKMCCRESLTRPN